MGPIRKTIRLVLMSFLVPALCLVPAWADVTDPCDSTSGPGSYQNLAPADRDYIGWGDPPDRSYLCQQSNRQAAAAVYRCSNASMVTAAIYSRHGSYASYSGGELVRGGDELPLWYRSSTGEVYCDGRRMVYDPDQRDFVFLEEEGRPSGLVEYGLTIYCSRDGASYTQVTASLVSAWREGPDAYWYEVYQADLEEGTRYVRLVLTDQSSIELLGREDRYQFETVGGLSLASVEIVEEDAPEGSQEEDGEPRLSGDPYGEYNGWTGSQGTQDLPSYQPGEEEGPESLPWGPEEDPADGGPAFPEENGEEEREEESSGGGASSGGGPSSSSKAPSQQSGSSAQKGQAGASGGPLQETSGEAARTIDAAPALRGEVPLWRRVTQPDAMTMIIISLTLLVTGVRILWEDSGRSGRRKELEQREERYARYMSYDGLPRQDRGDLRRSRRGPVRWDDEDDGWNDEDGWDG